jgi:hypothetical protein
MLFFLAILPANGRISSPFEGQVRLYADHLKERWVGLWTILQLIWMDGHNRT